MSTNHNFFAPFADDDRADARMGPAIFLTQLAAQDGDLHARRCRINQQDRRVSGEQLAKGRHSVGGLCCSIQNDSGGDVERDSSLC